MFFASLLAICSLVSMLPESCSALTLQTKSLADSEIVKKGKAA